MQSTAKPTSFLQRYLYYYFYKQFLPKKLSTNYTCISESVRTLVEISAMTTKLTLSVNEEAVKKAKRISNTKGKSVSKIFEDYINSLPEKEPEKSTSIRQISSMLKHKISIPGNIDFREFIRENRYEDYQKNKSLSNKKGK